MTALGLGVAFAPISAIGLLFGSSIAAGVATPVTLALMMAVGCDRTIMREYRLTRPLAVASWAVTAVVTGATIAYFVSLRFAA